jgi:hypothetical protein
MLTNIRICVPELLTELCHIALESPLICLQHVSRCTLYTQMMVFESMIPLPFDNRERLSNFKDAMLTYFPPPVCLRLRTATPKHCCYSQSLALLDMALLSTYFELDASDSYYVWLHETRARSMIFEYDGTPAQSAIVIIQSVHRFGADKSYVCLCFHVQGGGARSNPSTWRWKESFLE